MLTRIDRVQLAAPDRAVVAAAWRALLGAEDDGDDKVPDLGAVRTTLRLGTGWIEILEPDGAGVVADAVKARGAHLFAAGAATPDNRDVIAALRQRGVAYGGDMQQVFVDAGHGLRLVISLEQTGEPVGAIDYLYEVTNLVADAAKATADHASLLGLDPTPFVPIESKQYGYEGTLTLFRDDALHRFEVIHPYAGEKTMGRYFAKFGESLYMCFAEAGDLPAIRARADELGAGLTAAGEHTLFVHPKFLGGVMVGISRPTYAWSWSGHPERVEAPQ